MSMPQAPLSDRAPSVRLLSAFRPLWRQWAGTLAVVVTLLLLGRAAFSPSVLFVSHLVDRALSATELSESSATVAIVGGPEPSAWAYVQSAVAALTLIVLVIKLGERLRPQSAPSIPWRRFLIELEGGAAILCLTYALLQAVGGSHCPVHPLVYAVCAFLVSFQRQAIALSLAGLALLCELLLLFSEGTTEVDRYVVHALLIAMFAGLQFVLFRGELWRQRGDHRKRVAAAIASMEQQARDFRLLLSEESQRSSISSGVPTAASAGGSAGVSSGVPVTTVTAAVSSSSGAAFPRDREKEEELLARSAVVELKANLQAVVELLRNALSLHTCALFVLPDNGDSLKCMAMASHDESASAEPLQLDAGVLGTVVKSLRAVKLSQPKLSQLPYYVGAESSALRIGAFLGVPMLDDEGRLCGVLCADRMAGSALSRDVAFSESDESLLTDAALLVLRSLQCERLFIAVERSKYEHERLYRASSQLSRALTLEDVQRTAFAALAEVCAFDFAALTAYDATQHSHRVVASFGDAALMAIVEGLRFPDNAGLVAMAVKNHICLPKNGELRDAYTPIFDTDVRMRGYPSLLVVPLIYGSAALGSLVIAGRRPRLFSKSKIEMLGVLANQIGVSLENARMYQAMEAMATTDALTGLKNRRVFQERLSELLRRADRHGGPVTVLLCDIDHFKRINDTYGHLVGDQVLRRVAQVVQAQVRTIDVAARYGGEEFVVILDSTDQAGGRLLAERIRQEVQRLVLQSEKGAFSCTLSLGVATFPDDAPGAASEPRLIIECADQALYAAKRNGRNQSVTAREAAAVRTAA
jgi:diguanylate cyclase (GGDEF)-like protein